MGTIIGEGITFDDVLLVPQYSEVIPNQVDPVSYTHLDVYKRQVYGLSDLFIGEPLGAYASTVMLGYVNLQSEQIYAGVEELKKAWCR